MKRLVPVLALTLLVFGMGNRKLKRLSADERAHFEALDVFMDDDAEKAFLKLKTEEERNAFLKQAGLWERYYQYDAERRAEIAAGDVKVGWTDDQVYMAWDAPHDRGRGVRSRAAGRTETLVYNFLLTADKQIVLWERGSKYEPSARAKFRLVLTAVDGVITQMEKQDGFN